MWLRGASVRGKLTTCKGGEQTVGGKEQVICDLPKVGDCFALASAAKCPQPGPEIVAGKQQDCVARNATFCRNFKVRAD